MNHIISKISEIEASAASIMDAANERKKEYAKEMDEKTAQFDKELDEKTQAQLNQLRNDMESEAKQRLETQRLDAQHTMHRMEETYQAKHKQYVQTLFDSMTKE